MSKLFNPSIKILCHKQPTPVVTHALVEGLRHQPYGCNSTIAGLVK